MRSILDKSISSIPITTTKELKAVKYLNSTKILRFFGQARVTAQWCLTNPNKSISSTLCWSPGFINLYQEILQLKLRGKYRHSIPNTPIDLKHKLTPYHSKPPHLYGLPKTHKPGIHQRPIRSSIDSPCCRLNRFLIKIISPLVGKS